jgi:serine/threonine protein kinase
VIKNSKDFFDQSLDEIKLLQYINSKGDAHEKNVLQMIDYFYCKEHLFIVSELLRENLYEFQKYIRESGGVEYFTPNRLKRIMKQILEALVYIHSLNLLHCDIKPENIVIKSYSKCDVKLIDFGSSCFVTDHLTSYIQSRSYRAPEVILGMEYNYGIDIWSLGGVLAEMHTAYVLFQNDSIATMLSRIEGILGPYPPYMVESSPEAPKYFNMSGVIYERDEEDGSFSLIYPKKTSLRARMHLPPQGVASEDEELFLDFVTAMLQVDPQRRPSAAEALTHPWLEGADHLEVAYNIEDANPPLPSEEEDEDEDGDEEGYDVEEEEEEEDEEYGYCGSDNDRSCDASEEEEE